MSFKLLSFIAAMYLLWHPATQASPDLSEYNLVFNDEFDGSALDSAKWSTTHLWGPFVDINQEEQYYVDSTDLDQGYSFSPFVFTGDTLKIRAVEADATLVAPDQPAEDNPIWLSNPDFQYNEAYDPNDRNYLSGLISSVNSFNMTHGYVETRAKLPAGQGLWSAFWLLNSKYVEDVPEIDIMENLGHEPNKVYHTLHYFDINNGWQGISSPSYETTGPDYSADFHTYGVAWDPKKITWYVDGVAVRTITDSDFLVPKQSMYIIANLAVGGSWPGTPNATTIFPADFELDYIRAYQRKPVDTITEANLASEYQLMFSDEFNGSVLDPNKWNTSYLWGPFWQINNEEQYYVDILERDANHDYNPFNVSDGHLSITASAVEPEAVPDQPDLNHQDWQDYPVHQHNPAFKEPGGWTPKYLSGVLTSYDSFKFVHGYVEARINLPSGSGLWPAFWLLNGYYVGPMPEMDIMEFDGAHPGTIHHSYHYHDTNGELVSSATQTTTGGPYSDGFHTYGLQWEPGLIRWYLNGNIVRTLTGPTVSLQLSYIIANLAVGGNFVGEVDPLQFPASVKIDYIRAYQRKDSEPYIADTEPPVSTTLVPSANADASPEAITLQGTVTDSDGSGVKQVQIAIRDLAAEKWVDTDGSSDDDWYNHYATIADDSWSFATTLTAGQYNLFVRATDNSDNSESWNTRLFTIKLNDNIAPVATITFPEQGALVSNSPYLAGTVVDEGSAGLKHVQIALRDTNANTWIDLDGSSTSSWYEHYADMTNGNWAMATSLPAGNYTIFVRAADNNDNIEPWKTRPFSIQDNSDSISPVSIINAPIAGSVNASSVTVLGSVSDEGESGLKHVQVALRDTIGNTWVGFDGTASNSWIEQFADLAGNSWAVTATLNSGTYTLFIRASDNNNNVEQWQTRQFSVQAISDNVAPVTTILIPAAGLSYAASPLIEGSVADEGDSGVKHVRVAIRDIVAGEWVDVDGSVSGAWYDHFANLDNNSWNLPSSLSTGSYRIFVQSSDNNNNVEPWRSQIFNIE